MKFTELQRLLMCVAALWLAACSDGSDQPPIGNARAPVETPEAASDSGALEYPATPTVAAVDDYHGTEVADPYRWLERDVRESPEVADWVAAQNQVTDAYLETLSNREWFAGRLSSLWNYERFSLPVKRGDLHFYIRNDGLENQSRDPWGLVSCMSSKIFQIGRGWLSATFGRYLHKVEMKKQDRQDSQATAGPSSYISRRSFTVCTASATA